MSGWVYRSDSEARPLLMSAQHGRCGGCFDLIGDALVLDHDHATNLVRGLVCQSCNVHDGQRQRGPFTARLRAWDAYLAETPAAMVLSGATDLRLVFLTRAEHLVAATGSVSAQWERARFLMAEDRMTDAAAWTWAWEHPRLSAGDVERGRRCRAAAAAAGGTREAFEQALRDSIATLLSDEGQSEPHNWGDWITGEAQCGFPCCPWAGSAHHPYYNPETARMEAIVRDLTDDVVHEAARSSPAMAALRRPAEGI